MSAPTKSSVLFLDDEAPILMALQRILRKEPYESLFTSEPMEALNWVREGRVQVIVSDYRMEKMNGVVFSRAAHQVSPLTVKVIYSGYANEADIKKALDEKILYRFIAKPWDPKRICGDLREFFDEYERRIAAAALAPGKSV